MLTRRFFGATSAFVGTILVASQSSLLFSQAQEARHYAMFFACGAWVLYLQSLNDNSVKKYKWLTFFAHLCLCQVHYLGIIFSGLVGFSFLISDKEKPVLNRIPFQVYGVWIFTLLIYLFLLSHQSSHLGNWSKPNELFDLLAIYNNSLLFLTLLVPIFAFIITIKSNKNNKNNLIIVTYYPRSIVITSILWLSVPFLFWVISHLSSLNLFVNRYFIPKESGLIFLVAFGFNLIFPKLPKIKSISFPILVTFALSVVLVLVSTKRDVFGFSKDTNYHHSLIIKESYPTSKQPVILEGDHKYFPNAYLNNYECIMKIDDEEIKQIYKEFSKEINIQ